MTVAQGSSEGTPTFYMVNAVDTGRGCTVMGATGSCEVTGLKNGTPYAFSSTPKNEGGIADVSTPSKRATPRVAATVTFEVNGGTETIDEQTAGGRRS